MAGLDAGLQVSEAARVHQARQKSLVMAVSYTVRNLSLKGASGWVNGYSSVLYEEQ